MKAAAAALEEHTSKVERAVANFSRLAPLYRWMEWLSFGPFLSRCRFAFLDEMRSSNSALVIGDGDGRFTGRLLRINRMVHVDAVDASDAMLHQLLRRAGSDAIRVKAHVGDARQFDASQILPDLVATHFFLDCLTTAEVEALAMKLRGQMAPGKVWVVSEFAIPRSLYGQFFARPLVSALYLAFRLLTDLSIRSLPDHHAALLSAGFVLSRQEKWLGGLLVSEMWRAS